MAVPARRAEELARRRRPILRVVPRRRGRRRMPFLLLAGALVVGLILLLTSAQALVAQGAFRLSELNRRVDRLATDNDRLRLRVARESSPERIADAATRAGLVEPTQVEVLSG